MPKFPKKYKKVEYADDEAFTSATEIPLVTTVQPQSEHDFQEMIDGSEEHMGFQERLIIRTLDVNGTWKAALLTAMTSASKKFFRLTGRADGQSIAYKEVSVAVRTIPATENDPAMEEIRISGYVFEQAQIMEVTTGA